MEQAQTEKARTPWKGRIDMQFVESSGGAAIELMEWGA